MIYNNNKKLNYCKMNNNSNNNRKNNKNFS